MSIIIITGSAKKKKFSYVAKGSPDQCNLKIGSVGQDFFFFFFFETVRSELSFPIFFFEFLNG